ncbi:DNA helicase OS=Lysinibacillus sphaericus OX=1421 GN=LS41612_20625 PE=4 SV=1 [Lysinibacillus sphaericus]
MHLEDAKDLEAWATINTRLQKAIAKLEASVSPDGKERALAKSRQQPVQSFSLQNLNGVFAQLNASFQEGQTPSVEQLESYLLGLYMRRDFVWQKGMALRQQQEHKDREFESLRKNIASLIHQECAITSFDVQSLQRQLQPYLAHTERLQQLANTFQAETMPEESVEQLKMLVTTTQSSVQTARQQLQAVEQANTQLLPKRAAHQTAKASLQEIDEELAQLEEKIKAINIEGLKKEKQLTALTTLLQATPSDY